MKNFYKKIINIILISTLIFSPLSIFAFDTNIVGSQNTSNNYVPTGNAYNPSDPWGFNQTQTQTQNNNQVLNQNNVQRQIDGMVSNTQAQQSQGQGTQTGGAASAVGNVGGCGAGQLLSNIITSSVSKAIGNKVQDIAGTLTMVPVSEQGSVGENIKAQTSASVGTVGLGGILMSPGWNAAAYCIVNAMISYIADSTIQWINTGFNGNPAFLQNPDLFFKQLADEEAAAFIQNLAYGVSGGTNVCGVLKEAMVISTLSQYGYGYGSQNYDPYGYQTGGYVNKGISNGFLGCSFDQNPNQYNNFVQGNFIQGGGWNSWFNLTQTPQGNPFDTAFRVKDDIANKILTSRNSQMRDLNWNNGFLNYTTCTNNKNNKDTNKQDCKTVTPGRVIEGQLESTLNIPKERLVLAEKFDQVVTALVNQLITQAIGKVLQSNQ